MLDSRRRSSVLAACFFGASSALLLFQVLSGCMASREESQEGSASRSSREQDEADEEERVAASELPEPVRSAAQKYFADLQGCTLSREAKDGAPIFEIAGKGDGGRDLSVNVTASGSVLEIERETTADSLPPAVRATLARRFGNGTVRKAESVEVHYFEVLLDRDGEKVEVRVSAAGEVIQAKH